MQIKRAWAEIDRSILRANFLHTKSKTTAKILAMVKANGYGHGAVEVAKLFVECGADMLGVACAREAMELREGGLLAPILIVGYVPKAESEAAICAAAQMAVSTYEEAETISAAAVRLGKVARVHIKIDTGMTRLGFPVSAPSTKKDVLRIFALPSVEVVGMFTHFPCADEADADKTKRPFSAFCALAEWVEKASGKRLIKHAANSATLFRFPEMHLDMVRPGICLYGGNPLQGNPLVPPLCEAMRVRATVARVLEIPKGTFVGYGGTFCAERDMRVATVLIGYGDGISRSLSNRGYAIFKGKRVPIIGRICMDQLMLDITGIDGKADDVVTIRGREDGEAVTTEETAALLGTISYELFCNIGERIPRFYV